VKFHRIPNEDEKEIEMIKTNFVNVIATETGVSKRTIEEILDEFFSTVRNAIGRGEDIEIRGFACFRIQEREGYTGRNPQTGEAVEVPPKKIVKIIPSKLLVVED